MTDRSDIAHVPRLGRGRLEYTCNCGWIDWGHAKPDGANQLWGEIWRERSADRRLNTLALDLDGAPAYAIHYRQQATIRFGLTPGVSRLFAIRRGLTPSLKKAVALAIFMQVSHGFEGLQRAAQSASGYAVDDLISNLIGFYRAVNGYTMPYIVDRCGAVGVAASYPVYDAGGYEGHQWTRFDSARYFPCDACAAPPQFPPELRSIAPAVRGASYAPMTMVGTPDHALLSLGRPLSVLHTGQVLVR